MIDAITDFDHAISPTTPETFFADHFERAPLIVRRNAPDHYAGLLSMADVDHAVTSLAMTHADLQLVRTGEHVAAQDFCDDNGFVDPIRATREFTGGATMVMPALHRRLPRLASYCRALERVFSADLQTNIYLTPADAQGFNTHYDSHDVIVLQVEGSKEWRLYESDLKLPMRAQRFSPDGFEPGPVTETFTLHAGDMLYLPRGIVHDARATDEVSLHVTTGLMTRTWTDLMLEAVASVALADVDFRRTLPPGYATGTGREAARATFRDLMTRVADRADADAALDTFAADHVAGRRPVVAGHFTDALAAADLAPDSVAGGRPDLIATIAEDAGEDVVRLDCYGREVCLPLHAAETLRAAVGTGRYRIADLPGEIDDAGKVVLVRRLVREGAVRLL